MGIGVRSFIILGPACCLLAQPQAAQAQRVSENATTQSSDAFGRSVGNEKTGLYTSEDVRGFNPVDAGNVRLEGLYFDQIDRVSMRLIDGNTIRVGPATLRYAFPAPTGLVDYSLSSPMARPSIRSILKNPDRARAGQAPRWNSSRIWRVANWGWRAASAGAIRTASKAAAASSATSG